MAPKVAHGRAVLPAESGRENGLSFSGGRLLQGLWSAGTRCIFFDLTYMHARWPKELGRPGVAAVGGVALKSSWQLFETSLGHQHRSNLDFQQFACLHVCC
jgi:hypothetical protein